MRTQITKMIGMLAFIGSSAYAADTTPPVIRLNTPDTVKINIMGTYVEVAPTITDNQSDSASIIVSKSYGNKGAPNMYVRGWYSVTYEATDSNGNKSSKTRYILIDDLLKPSISLNTPNPVYHKKGTPYNPVQPSVIDNYYSPGQISLVLVSSDVNIYVNGTYQDVYEATDPSGNINTAIRTVIVGDLSNEYPANSYSIRVSPNPANQNIKISLATGISEIGVKICSPDGKIIKEETGVKNGSFIDTSILGTGVYTVLMDFGGMVITSKLVIQR